MSDSFLAALRAGTALPATGTAHGHVRLQNGLLARVAYAHEGDPAAAGRLQVQAAAFRHLAPAGRTPKLHEVIEPHPGLPGGALVVDFIEGRAPRLPGELGTYCALTGDRLDAADGLGCGIATHRVRSARFVELIEALCGAGVWVVLLILFGASLGSAYLPLGVGNLALNLLIAAIMIVVLVTFLMDLKEAAALLHVVAGAGLLWLLLMFALTFSDYLSRYY